MSDQRSTEQVTAEQRTELQAAADKIDCDLYRTIARLEALHDKHARLRPLIAVSLTHLRRARPNIRALMSKSDREATI